MSMPIDPFPVDPNRIVQQLARRVAALEARLGVQPAVEVSAASGPFFLPDGAAFTGQAGGLRMGAVGSQFRVVDAVGNVIDIPIGFMASITTANAGASYDGTTQTLINALKTGHNDLLTMMKAYRVMKSF